MKTKIGSLLTVGLCLLALSAAAQSTNTPLPAPPQNAGTFFSSVADYFASFNTNLDESVFAARGKLWTGADSIQGGNVSLANSLGLSYNIYQPTNSAVRLGAESVTRNSGVAGTLVSEQIGPQINFVIHDTTITGYGDGLYNFDPASHVNKKGKTIKDNPLGAEIGLRLQKALTVHTFAGTGVGAQLPKPRQVFQVFAGFTF